MKVSAYGGTPAEVLYLSNEELKAKKRALWSEITFSPVLPVFRSYRNSVDLSQDSMALASEIEVRIQQLNCLLKKVFESNWEIMCFYLPLDRVIAENNKVNEHLSTLGLSDKDFYDHPEYKKGFNRLKSVDLVTMRPRVNELSFETRLNAESFYFFAWRLCSALGNKKVPFPNVGSLKPRGILMVRNKLIEHVEGEDSFALRQEFSYGGLEGPRIKTTMQGNRVLAWLDPGLFVNSKELKADLIKILEKATLIS